MKENYRKDGEYRSLSKITRFGWLDVLGDTRKWS